MSHLCLFSSHLQSGSQVPYESPNESHAFIRDIAPVAGFIRGTHVLVVNPSVPAKTVPEFIAHAKANPGKINMASAGIGSTMLPVNCSR